MYNYRPDIIAKTRIPGHSFVHWPFIRKFVPPSLFLTTQMLLVPLIYMKGNWSPLTAWLLIVTFLVPAATAIMGRWLAPCRVFHAPLAYLTLFLLGYFGGVGSPLDWVLLVGFNLWSGIYWAIMGAGLSDPLKRMLEVLDSVKNGAGFAVVADEVRNLAMRASEASKNTAERIETTVSKVKQGSELVDKTGASFGMVLENTNKISDVINLISEASDEQVKGIGEITITMAEINSLTQQNAAISDRLAGLMHSERKEVIMAPRVVPQKRLTTALFQERFQDF